MMNFKRSVKQIVGAGAILALSAGSAYANLLTNPGFEDTPFTGAEEAGAGTGWLTFNSNFRVQQVVVPGDCNPISCAGAHGGTVALKNFGNAGVYQDFAASEGDEFDGSVWAINPQNADVLGGGQIAQALIIFTGGAGATESSNVLTSTDPVDVWTLLSVSGTAPAGTTGVRFQLQTMDTGAGGGAPRWDDASFDAAVIPVPAAVWLFGSGLVGLVGVARRRKAKA